METKSTDEYLSVIGTAVLQPILELWEKLEKIPRKRPNQVQTSHKENGYAVSIIILTIAMVESLLSRTRLIMHSRGIHTIPQNQREPLLQFFKMKFRVRRLANRLEELYVIRDVVIHNLIWEAEIPREGRLIHKKPPTLSPGYRDRKFRSRINLKNRCTKILRLNLFPTRIWRRDAEIVLKTAYEILYHVQSQSTSYCVVSWIPTLYKGKGMEFSQFIRILSGEAKDFVAPIAGYSPD